MQFRFPWNLRSLWLSSSLFRKWQTWRGITGPVGLPVAANVPVEPAPVVPEEQYDPLRVTAATVRRMVRVRLNHAKLDPRCMPKWVDIRAIAEIYGKARRLKKVTGADYNVDHIIPLKGYVKHGKERYYVTGLYVPWNLQVTRTEVNRNKGNSISYWTVKGLYGETIKNWDKVGPAHRRLITDL